MDITLIGPAESKFIPRINSFAPRFLAEFLFLRHIVALYFNISFYCHANHVLWIAAMLNVYWTE